MEEQEPLSLVLPMSRAAGLAPYDSIQHMRLSRPALLYSYLLHVSLSVTTMYLILHVETSKIGYSRVAWLVNSALLEVIIWISVIRGPKKLREFLFALTHVKKICRLVKHNDTRNAAQRSLRWMFMLMVCGKCAVLLLILMLKLFNTNSNILSAKQPYAKLFFDMKSIVLLLLTAQFVLLSTKVNCALGAVNCALRQLCTKLCPHGGLEEKQENQLYIPKNISGVSFINVKPKLVTTFDHVSVQGTAAHVRLRSLACTYVSSCDLARTLGDAAGPLLLLLLTSNILNLIQGIYFFIMATGRLSVTDPNTMVLIGTATTNCLLYIVKFIFLVSPCHDLSEELENTRFLVSHLSCEASPDSEAFRAELDVFSIHLGCNQPHYSALGVFTLDRPFALTVAAFIATYLIVLLGI